MLNEDMRKGLEQLRKCEVDRTLFLQELVFIVLIAFYIIRKSTLKLTSNSTRTCKAQLSTKVISRFNFRLKECFPNLSNRKIYP
jgi:hypothetical protein